MYAELKMERFYDLQRAGTCTFVFFLINNKAKRLLFFVIKSFVMLAILRT